MILLLLAIPMTTVLLVIIEVSGLISNSASIWNINSVRLLAKTIKYHEFRPYTVTCTCK